METQYQLTYDAEQPRDYAELDVEDAFGDHNIEYWVRRGNKLVPATDAEIAQIHEWEREASARARLALWKRSEACPWPARLLHGVPFRGVMWLRQRLGQPRTPAGAPCEQEQGSHSPIQPRTAGGHDEHGNETAM
jgi:hypothetical protein